MYMNWEAQRHVNVNLLQTDKYIQCNSHQIFFFKLDRPVLSHGANPIQRILQEVSKEE